MQIISLLTKSLSSSNLRCGVEIRDYKNKSDVDVTLDEPMIGDEIIGIVGGKKVEAQQLPWQAYLQIFETGQSQTICGGTVLSRHHILTAAHCMKQMRA